MNSEDYHLSITGPESLRTYAYVVYFALSIDIHKFIFNPLTPDLNPSEQRCLPQFFTGDFKF